MAATSTSILARALLDERRERAPIYDRENRFFQDPLLAHDIVGRISIGISPDEQPQWG